MTARRVTARRALAVAALAVGGLGVFVVHGATVVHPVTEDDAVRAYADRPRFDGLGGRAGSAGRASPAGVRPLGGVYRYRTEGWSRVDRLALLRAYPATTTRVVRHGPGCEWQETLEILREHVETYTSCATGGDQRDIGYTTALTYFRVPGTSASACEPPGTRTGAGLDVGGSRAFRCTDRSGRVRTQGTATYVGDDRVTVDGHAVGCRVVRVLSVLSGDTEGVALRELCTVDTTGLVLRESRRVGLSLRSRFLGRIRYTEEAEFTLLTLDPRTR